MNGNSKTETENGNYKKNTTGVTFIRKSVIYH